MIKLIIFDYDGVIVDSFPTVHKTYQTICKGINKSCPSTFEEFKKLYGEGSKELFKNLELSIEEINAVNGEYKKEILKANPPVFEGITQVIKELSQKYKLVLISSSPREEVMQKLTKAEINKYFSLIFASDKSGSMRKAEAINETLNKMQVSPDDVILIGDRNSDFRDGKEARLSNVLLVDYGWGYDLSKIPEYKQKAIVKTPHDILEAVKKF